MKMGGRCRGTAMRSKQIATPLSAEFSAIDFDLLAQVHNPKAWAFEQRRQKALLSAEKLGAGEVGPECPAVVFLHVSALHALSLLLGGIVVSSPESRLTA